MSTTVAVIQCPLGDDRETNVARVVDHVRAAAARGANVILPPELFEGPYFCRVEDERELLRAMPFEGNPTIARFAELARELGVVIPVSFFERAGQAYYNSLAMVDADGTVMGLYRKSHIPDGPGYQEKFYFTPGDTGFRIWHTRAGNIGVGICWDQWYPEAARVMVLMGAELLLYPTAIGSEPQASVLDSSGHWQRAMQGHAASNMVPVIAANRIGTEAGESCSVTFYGSSFITDGRGEILAQAPRDAGAVVSATLDLDALALARAGWGLFRDRRPDLYVPVLSLDGQDPAL